ncbi:MAG: hypothetical protein OEZ59_06290 [Deltaproteobacteria bacterium]|nr:hypothetical protein [Deltaproteobacteria bacterium]
MLKYIGLIKAFISITASIILSSCISTSPINKNDYVNASLATFNYSRAEKKITSLKKGDVFKIDFYMLFDHSYQGIPLADGWVGMLSNDVCGLVISKENNHVVYSHVFGYVLLFDEKSEDPRIFRFAQKGVSVLIPQYEVIMEGREDPQSEFDQKQEGSCMTTTMYKAQRLMDNRVLEVRKLDFMEPEKSEIFQLTTNFSHVLSHDNFIKTRDRIQKLKTGTAYYNVIQHLDGKFISLDGNDPVLVIDGLLPDAGKYQWGKYSKDPAFKILPFGYMEEGRAIPILALVFSRASLHEIVPYAP